MYRLILIIVALFMTSAVQAATLEIPGSNSTQSGVQLISGWKCEATGPLTIRFDGGNAIPLLYGSERGDTRKPKGPCDDAKTGFIAIMNWGNLSDGEHTAVVYDNGEEFDRATFWVVTTGTDFLQGVTGSGTATLSNGQRATLEWSEASQGFVAADFTDIPESGECTPQTKTATVYWFDESSQWTVTNPCDGDTLTIDVRPLTAEGFFACKGALEIVQDGVQYEADLGNDFRWRDNRGKSVCITIFHGITLGTTLSVNRDSRLDLDFREPFTMYYEGTLIFEFP